MNIDALEAEKLAHLNTREAVVKLSAALLQSDRTAFFAAVGRRLGIADGFQIMNDGTVVEPPPPPAEEAPPEPPTPDAPA